MRAIRINVSGTHEDMKRIEGRGTFGRVVRRQSEILCRHVRKGEHRGGAPAQGRGNAAHTLHSSPSSRESESAGKGGTDKEAIPQKADRHHEAVRRRYYDTTEIDKGGESYQDTFRGRKGKYGARSKGARRLVKTPPSIGIFREIDKSPKMSKKKRWFWAAEETAREELRRAKKEIQTKKLKRAATTAAANIAESVGSLFGSNKVKTLERENTALHREVADHGGNHRSPARQNTAHADRP